MNRQSIFITGAASGIGRAVAHRFANRDWRVGLSDIEEKSLKDLHDQIDGDAGSYCVDVTDPPSVEAALNSFAEQSEGRLNVLFLSAGITRNGRFEEVPAETHRQILAVNAGGVATCARMAFPFLKQTPDARLICMSSASASYGTPEMASYSASKFAVRGLTESLNLEWEEHDIHVCDVMPPFVKTPMLEQEQSTRSMNNLGVNLTAEDVANVVERAATSSRKKVHWPVSSSFKLLYRVCDLLPRELVRPIMKRISGF